MKYVDKISINDELYDIYYHRNWGVNYVSTLSNLPVDKRLIYAELVNGNDLSITEGMEEGDDLYIICKINATTLSFTFNDTDNYKFIFNNKENADNYFPFFKDNYFRLHVIKYTQSLYLIEVNIW